MEEPAATEDELTAPLGLRSGRAELVLSQVRKLEAGTAQASMLSFLVGFPHALSLCWLCDARSPSRMVDPWRPDVPSSALQEEEWRRDVKVDEGG
jgi:hypothetical protein